MAIVQADSLTEGFRGRIGRNLVFRNLRGKTIVYKKPEKPKKQSELQRENRNRFKDATFYARAMMHNPEKKAYYWRKAKKMNLPNAYTAAITDYMRRPLISLTDPDHYYGQEGHAIKITTFRKRFSVNTIGISIKDDAGNILEEGLALNISSLQEWRYITKNAIPPDLPHAITISASYAGGNIQTLKILL